MRSGLAAACAIAVVLVGCTSGGGTGEQAGSTSEAPDDVRLHASLVQYRSYEGTNRIDVQLTNRGDRLVRVEKVHLTWSGLTATPTSGAGTDYDPGRIIDIQTTFGTPVCDDDPADEIQVDVRLGDGRTITLPVDQPGSALLRRLHERECKLAAITAVADIALSPRFTVTPGGAELRGSVVVTRTPESRAGDRQQVAIEGLLGSVLLTFTYAGEGSLPVLLRPADDSISVPVALGPERCDAHALGESQQTFLFSVHVRLDDTPAQGVIVSPTAAVQRRASAMITRVCG